MKISENRKCHFLDIVCRFPIPEKRMYDALKIGYEISYRPSINSAICTNCLISLLVEKNYLKKVPQEYVFTGGVDKF
jgi:hypothetical protein